MSEPDRFRSLDELRRWAGRAPAGVSMDLHELADVLEGLEPDEEAPPLPQAPEEPPEWTWREKLWTCPAETRLGVVEVAEALDRSKSWIYRRTGNAADPTDRLPCRRLDGELVFTAGELRTWIRDHEEVLHAVPMTSTAGERGLRVVGE